MLERKVMPVQVNSSLNEYREGDLYINCGTMSRAIFNLAYTKFRNSVPMDYIIHYDDGDYYYWARPMILKVNSVDILDREDDNLYRAIIRVSDANGEEKEVYNGKVNINKQIFPEQHIFALGGIAKWHESYELLLSKGYRTVKNSTMLTPFQVVDKIENEEFRTAIEPNYFDVEEYSSNRKVERFKCKQFTEEEFEQLFEMRR